MTLQSIAKVTGEIVDLLTPLSSEERGRVINASLALLGEESGIKSRQPVGERTDADEAPHSEESLAKFAKRLGSSVGAVNGSLSPSKEPPYLELNPHNWEAFKKNFPKRGPGAVSPIGLAGAALALWIKEAKLGISVTQALAAAVLDTIGIKDPNPSRGIKNTKWLQGRAGGIIVNPAEISKAQDVIGSYCSKKKPSNES